MLRILTLASSLLLFSSLASASPKYVSSYPRQAQLPGTSDQTLIHQADLLPSGIYSLRRQKQSGIAKAIPGKKPRKKVTPDTMAMMVGR